MAFEDTVAYRRTVERIEGAWSSFLAARRAELTQERRFGRAAEKVSENVLRDLLSEVLDWPKSSINYQVDRSDMLVTDLGVRRLLIETKYPDSLAWNRSAADKAVDQARHYADHQGVKVIAISDARILYAADIVDGGLQDRLFVDLEAPEPQHELCWLSRHGVYRPRPIGAAGGLQQIPLSPGPKREGDQPAAPGPDQLLHPKYHLPARCFAYVGRADRPQTWKLPYLLLDGHVDRKRLPKAVQAILTNYRGAKVSQSSIPESSIPAVLQRLAETARGLHLLPPEAPAPALVYRQLADAVEAEQRRG